MSITCLRCRARLNDSMATRNNATRAMNSIPAMVPATTSRSTHRPDTKDIGTAVAQLHLESATGGFSEAVSFLLDLVEELLWRLTLIFTSKVPSSNVFERVPQDTGKRASARAVGFSDCLVLNDSIGFVPPGPDGLLLGMDSASKAVRNLGVCIDGRDRKLRVGEPIRLTARETATGRMEREPRIGSSDTTDHRAMYAI
jgi:hypothetical protein